VTGSNPEVTSFDWKSPGSGCRRQKTGYTVHFTSYEAVAPGGGSHVTGNDVTRPQVPISDPELTSFDRRLPRSGCRRLKTGVYCTFHFLEGCRLQDEAVTWQEMTSRDFRWPDVTRKWRPLTGSHLEVAVEARKLAYTVHFTSHKVVARRRRQSRDRKWCHMTQVAISDPNVTSFDQKSPGSACRRPKTGVHCAFHCLQGCSSPEEAVTWQEMTSRGFRWPVVTRKWRHLTGSHLEVAVGRKLAYTVHFPSCKAVVRRRSQSCDRKWRHVTPGYGKWPRSDVIWGEVTWRRL